MLPTKLKPDAVELIQKTVEAEVKLTESIQMVRQIKRTISGKVFEDLTDGHEFGLAEMYSPQEASNSDDANPVLAPNLKPTGVALNHLYNANFEVMMALGHLYLNLKSSKQRKKTN